MKVSELVPGDRFRFTGAPNVECIRIVNRPSERCVEYVDTQNWYVHKCTDLDAEVELVANDSPPHAWLKKYHIAAEDFLSAVGGAQDVFATHFKDGKPVGDGKWRIASVAKAVEQIEQASNDFVAAMDAFDSAPSTPEPKRYDSEGRDVTGLTGLHDCSVNCERTAQANNLKCRKIHSMEYVFERGVEVK